MAGCDLTFSTFSAGANSPTGVRKGWRAKVADQLIGGKRFIGRTASAAATEPSLNTTKGHHSIIVDDCVSSCKVYGSTYSRASDGKLKARANVGEGPIQCSSFPNIINPNTLISVSWNVSGQFDCGTCPPSQCSPAQEETYNQALARLLHPVTCIWSTGTPGAIGTWVFSMPGPCGSGVEVDVLVTIRADCFVVIRGRAWSDLCREVVSAPPSSCIAVLEAFATELPWTIGLQMCGIGFGAACSGGEIIRPTGSVTIGIA